MKKIADHPTADVLKTDDLPPMSEVTIPFLCPPIPVYLPCILSILRKADIRNPLSLLAHERSRFATCQWELLTPTDISIPLTHHLVLYALEAGECLFCVHFLAASDRLSLLFH